MVSMNHIRQAVETVAPAFPIKKVELFGSYASGTAQEHSDADFLVEFNESPVSLLKLFGFQEALAEMLKIDVDVIEIPLQPDGKLQTSKRSLPMKRRKASRNLVLPKKP